jgi:hypothetical protein
MIQLHKSNSIYIELDFRGEIIICQGDDRESDRVDAEEEAN